MPEPARHLATWADLVRTPDDGRVHEVLDGEIEASPRPSRIAECLARSARRGFSAQ